MNKGKAITGGYEWGSWIRKAVWRELLKKNRGKRGREAERMRELLTGKGEGMGGRLAAIEARWANV